MWKGVLINVKKCKITVKKIMWKSVSVRLLCKSVSVRLMCKSVQQSDQRPPALSPLLPEIVPAPAEKRTIRTPDACPQMRPESVVPKNLSKPLIFVLNWEQIPWAKIYLFFKRSVCPQMRAKFRVTEKLQLLAIVLNHLRSYWLRDAIQKKVWGSYGRWTLLHSCKFQQTNAL